tara:strand:- start:1162 stop:1569 length:408 start_codon:yes stop_codon:yes gene_type:complete
MARRTRHDRPTEQATPPEPSNTQLVDDTADDTQQRPSAIPPNVWVLLQSAGERAAGKLNDMLSSIKFDRLKPTEQARLVELALNRAYGPPIKREMSLQLTGNVSDAVAASLASLSATDLPELSGKPKPTKPPRAI